MKKSFAAVLAALLLSIGLFGSPASADKPDSATCATIAGGTITDSANNPIGLGYDEFGYNYQARLFNGTYDSSDRNIDGTYWGGTGDFVDDELRMKWSDAWLSNKDCNGDGKLDRGVADEAGDWDNISRGWLTNEVTGDYFDDDGNIQHTAYFVKIVWTGPGSPLWGQYTIIQEVWNDAADGETGLYGKIGTPGFGLNDQWTTN